MSNLEQVQQEWIFEQVGRLWEAIHDSKIRLEGVEYSDIDAADGLARSITFKFVSR